MAVIQVSAVGAEPEASTDFMRSKARGDAALLASGVRLWVLRPGLVIGQEAFGGTLMLRMLAAVPVVQPVALAGAPIRCVGLPDLARVVAEAVDGALPAGRYDLVEPARHDLETVILRTRCWLGFDAPHVQWPLPRGVARGLALGADALGRLGWRSPLRSTALRVLEEGITGDPSKYLAVSGRELAGLDAIYDSFSAARAQRIAARAALMMLVCVAVLSVFWVLSGLIGVARLDTAAAVLEAVGWPVVAARASVVFWAVLDIGLGAAILWRRWAARACLGMAGVSVIYMVAAALLTPALWADPLGPMLKVVPGMILALVT